MLNKGIWLAILISSLTILPSHAQTIESVQPHTPDLSYTGLDELGYHNGYLFEGVSDSAGHTFYFPAPSAAKIRSAALLLSYVASTGLSPKSMLRVDVNGRVRYSGAVDHSGNVAQIKIPIKLRDINVKEPVKVTVRTSLIASENRCLDTRLSVHFLQLQPSTALRLQMVSGQRSVLSSYEMLPKEVTISLQDSLSPELYRSAFVLAHHLSRQGKQVAFVNLPKLGDIIVASKESVRNSLARIYTDKKGKPLPFPKLESKANLTSLQLPDRNILINSEPFINIPSNLISWEWKKLATSSLYFVNKANHEGTAPTIGASDYIFLKDTDIDLTPHYHTTRTEWNLSTRKLRIPANRKLKRIQLEVTSAPNENDEPTLLNIFLNNQLQEVVALKNDGQPEIVSVHLSDRDLLPLNNYIQIVAQRPHVEGDCSSNQASYPIQLGKGSYLEVEQGGEKTPETFNDIHSYFNDGLVLFLNEQALQNPDESLSFLSGLIAKNELPLSKIEIQFVQSENKIQPDRPFIYFGTPTAGLEQSSVFFDQGRIQVIDYKDEVLLDLDELPHVVITQFVQSKKFYGLWIKPSTKGNPASFLLNGQNNVIFSDSEGVMMKLNTREPDLSQVDYPDHDTWIDFFDQYKFWFAAIAWILLTALFVTIYLTLRKHDAPNK